MIYCLRCKQHTETINQMSTVSKNNRPMIKGNCKVCNTKKSSFVKSTKGGKVDIHSLIGKLPKPKNGWTPPGYKYMGPYNPLEKQLKYDKNTGEITDWMVRPKNRVDEISAYHDVCYDMGKDKNVCDKKMVNSLNEIPSSQMPYWGKVAKSLINSKQKLGWGN